MDSILTSIKKLLGIEEDYTHFDEQIIMHINSMLMVVNQLGIGPETGFSIHDKTKTWTDLLTDATDIEAVKSYVYLKVRLIFDPPTITSVIQSIDRQILELEWRLKVQATEPTVVEGDVADA